MPLARQTLHPRDLFTAENLAEAVGIPHPPGLEDLCATVLATCPEFAFLIRDDDGIIVIHPGRLTATTEKNIVTFWLGRNRIEFDIRPRPAGVNGPQVHVPGAAAFAQRLDTRQAYLGGL